MRRFPVLLSLLFLLTGCAAGSLPDNQSALSETDSLSWVLYDPDREGQSAAGSAFSSYSLKDMSCTGILPLKDRLLLFTEKEDSTVLSLLDPATGCICAAAELCFPLSAGDVSIHPLATGFSCFDPVAGFTLTLDDNLQITARIPAPVQLVGNPILSKDGAELYYCTAEAIRSLDLASGISRVLKECAYPHQQLCGLFMEDTILMCRTFQNPSNALFLSAKTGASLGSSDRMGQTDGSNALFLGFLQEGNLDCLIFADGNRTLQTLILSDHKLKQYLLPQSHALLAIQPMEDDALRLHHYDLLSGHRTGTLLLNAVSSLHSFVSTEDGCIWFLGYDEKQETNALFRWNPALSPANDGKVYTQPYYSAQQPDETGIGQCLDYALRLEEKFGIEIRIYKDAAAVKSNEYQLHAEHLAPVLKHELQQLEKNLAHYPPEILQTLARRFDNLRICILRSISPIASPENVNAVTFWENHQPCIALTSGTDTQKALFHELCHLIDTIVLNETSAYDTWNQLNPTGFEYDYDYTANQSRNSTAFLLDANRYFVDMYSMSFPKEDRARIMEYAMTPGNEKLFQGEAMQNKLFTLCTGIRKAFRLTKSTESYLWEQYLHHPLAAR